MADDKFDITLVESEADLLPVDYEAQEARERLEKNIARAGDAWGLTPKALEAKKAAMTMIATKNGLYAKVPLVCKADACPYAEQCQLLPYDLAPEGEYCPTELAQIDIRQKGYAEDIGLEDSSFTDKVLMSELVTLDIILERCKSLMAKDGTPVIQMSIGVDQEGNEIDQPAVSKAWEAYERVSKRREAVYSNLMLTRKDHKNDDGDNETQSVSALLRNIIESPIDITAEEVTKK